MNKSLPIAYLLWLFTGVFGGHRWYLGKRWSALAMSVGGIVLFTISVSMLISPSQTLDGFYEAILVTLNDPINDIMKIPEYEPHVAISGILFLFSFFLIPVALLLDLFWIYFLIKEQPNTLTQQQVEAFD
ncbi:TM2 domain-containing protein [Kiloniella majae]|uniref:TM2 domain-containing protein n=1 Tax=Kiloniella majae TaxID=1938558 RepID=UPI000A27918E|nr:TM2 domain-containing protein [Kiloniella majae]